MPREWLRESWIRSGGRATDRWLDDETLRRLLPLLPRMRAHAPTAGAVAQLLAILLQHTVDAESLPADVPISPLDDLVLGRTARLADALLRVRVVDVTCETVVRLVLTGWVGPGTRPIRCPGPACEAVMHVVPHRWARMEIELVPADERPILGQAVLSEQTVLAAQPGWRLS